ncbi:MAG: hypothetical protein IJO91_07975 [Oscillospiraceae bacterium]|nr:hypothetical protein [Oscillospiraceae bacterium]
MESRWTTAIIAVLSVFVIVFFVGQMFFTGGETLRTETAYAYDMTEDIPFEGVYLRNETVVYSAGTGVLSYEHQDSSKVGKSSVIAYRYRNEGDIDLRRQIEELDAQIDVLTHAQKLVGTDTSQLETITSQINSVHSSLIDSVLGGSYAAAAEYKNQMLEALCKREIAKGESVGYSDKIETLTQRRAQLSAQLSGDVQSIYSGGTGYFVSGVDGYEDKLGFEDGDTLTADRIDQIVEDPDISGSEKNAIGKLIADYRWRAAAVLNSEKLFGIYEGSTVTLRVGSQNVQLEAVVVSIRDTGRGDGTAVYVFECDRLTSAVVEGRTAHFKLVVNSYGGLRVSRGAIRYDDNEVRGVYVVRGSSLVFKKINVIYWGEDYVICSQEEGDDYLKLYDEIVTEGKDLYDGKIVE